MGNFFKDTWENLKNTAQEELEDLSYMEIVTGVSKKVDGHIDNEGWDILDSLRRGKPPSDYGTTREREREIKAEDMLSLKNTEILARTRIELDGDVFNLLKSKEGDSSEIRKEVMDLHKTGIEVSVQNWKYFLEFILGLTATIGVIVGQVDPSRLSSLDRVSKL